MQAIRLIARRISPYEWMLLVLSLIFLADLLRVIVLRILNVH